MVKLIDKKGGLKMNREIAVMMKRILTVFLSVILLSSSMLPLGTNAVTTATANENGTFTNPVIFSDVPDPGG